MRDHIPDPDAMATVSQMMLDDMIEKHSMFLRGENGGARCVLKYRNISNLNFGASDLSQADFTGSHFVGANLSGGKFSGTTFFGCDLSKSNLTDANLSRADLRGAYMAGANLSRAILKDADMREGKIMTRDERGVLADRARSAGAGSKTVFKGAKLTGTNMSGAQAISADFSDADLSSVNLTGANLRQVNFHGANLAHADLSNSDLTEASLRNSILAGTVLDNTEQQNIDLEGVITEREMGSRHENLGKTLPDLLNMHVLWISTAGNRGRQLDLSGYDLRDVIDLRTYSLTAIKAVSTNFLNQDLRHVEMQSAVLDYSDFRDCNLEKADLRGSHFKHAQMARVNFSGALLCPLEFRSQSGSRRRQRVDMTGANFRYANFTNTDLRDCILMGVDLSHAILRGCNLCRADLSGAILKGTVFENVRMDDAIIDFGSF